MTDANTHMWMCFCVEQQEKEEGRKSVSMFLSGTHPCLFVVCIWIGDKQDVYSQIDVYIISYIFICIFYGLCLRYYFWKCFHFLPSALTHILYIRIFTYEHVRNSLAEGITPGASENFSLQQEQVGIFTINASDIFSATEVFDACYAVMLAWIRVKYKLVQTTYLFVIPAEILSCSLCACLRSFILIPSVPIYHNEWLRYSTFSLERWIISKYGILIEVAEIFPEEYNRTSI